MKHRITILTLSRKWGGRCVVGYDHNEKRMVRLVSDVYGRELDVRSVDGLNLLDSVEVVVKKLCPYEHQTENILLFPNYSFKIIGNTDKIEMFDSISNSTEEVFGDNRYKLNDVSNVNHSIELIKFDKMYIYVEDGKTKADFLINGKNHRWYRVTDIVHEGKSLLINKGYAVITLPPSDDFTSEYGYFKYISAIYPLS